MTRTPVWDGYFADPFVLRTDDGFVAYGTDPSLPGDVAFEALRSDDLVHWRRVGPVLAADPAIGTDHWAPEAVVQDGAAWLFYSAGRGIHGHHLRVARAETPLGPFTDSGVDLSPDESFAIDAHPFVDDDGSRYLFFARDVLAGDRPGTHLAVQRMRTWTEPQGPVVPVLAPNADWQRYQADRAMYGRRYDWHTLEGPAVVRRGDHLVLLYSGGSWEGDEYGVGVATAPHPLGPWTHVSDRPDLLSSASTGLPGPGHNSLVTDADGALWTAYHAWDATRTRRQPYLERLHWEGGLPALGVGRASDRDSNALRVELLSVRAAPRAAEQHEH